MNEVSERLALPDEDIVLLVLMVLMIPLPVALKLIPAHRQTHTHLSLIHQQFYKRVQSEHNKNVCVCLLQVKVKKM